MDYTNIIRRIPQGHNYSRVLPLVNWHVADLAVLATNVEENDRAMAADGTTKAIVSPSPR